MSKKKEPQSPSRSASEHHDDLHYAVHALYRLATQYRTAILYLLPADHDKSHLGCFRIDAFNKLPTTPCGDLILASCMFKQLIFVRKQQDDQQPGLYYTIELLKKAIDYIFHGLVQAWEPDALTQAYNAELSAAHSRSAPPAADQKEWFEE
jgi:hypothetical protein